MDDTDFHGSKWGSPEPKVVVQKLSVDPNSPQKAYLSWLGWTIDEEISPQRPEKLVSYKSQGCHHHRRVRRRLISDEPAAYDMEDDEPLAQILDEQLFPEIGNSDDLLKSPPNVDFLLGSVTPKNANDWDLEETLKSHKIDIFGNEDDRQEFTDFCESLMAGPSGDSLYNNNQREMECYDVQSTSPQSNWSYMWASNESELQSLDEQNHYGDYENPNLMMCDGLLLPNDQQESSNYSINSCPPYISPAFSNVTSPEFCSQEIDQWSMERRNRRWRKRRLGLRACDALYFDGEKYVSIKVITDGTKKYRLVIPKNHKHSKGMPEDVAIFTAMIHEPL